MISHIFSGNARIWLFSLFWAAIIPLLLPLKYSTKIVHQILQYLLVFGIVLPTFLFLARRVNSSSPKFPETLGKGGGLMWVSTLLCCIVFCFYWIIFYPGFISWDFYVQWHQMDGRIPYSDWHPVFHTLTLWLVTLAWHSPAMVSLVQFASLAILVGMVSLQLYRAGAPLWLTLMMSCFYAIFPLNGLYAVSLWKDIAYSIAFLWLNYLVITLALEKGRSLSRLPFVVSLLSAIFSVVLLRHNGVVPACGTLIIITAIFLKTHGRTLLVLWIALILALVLFKGPLFSALNVDVAEKNVLKAHLPIQHIGAVLQEKSNNLKDQDIAVLTKILPLSRWRDAFDPRSCMPLIFGKDDKGKHYLNGGFLKKDGEYKTFLSIWAKAVINNPSAIFNYHLAGSELLWKIHVPYSVFVLADEDLQEEHLYNGYRPSTSLSNRVGPVGQLIIKMINDSQTSWFMSRGALYFWLSILFLSMIAIRLKFTTVILLSMPIILQALTILAFPLVQDTRFMFPIILVAPLYPVLFSCRVHLEREWL